MSSNRWCKESQKYLKKIKKTVISPKKVTEYLTVVKVIFWRVSWVYVSSVVNSLRSKTVKNILCTLLRGAKGRRVSAHLPDAQTF